MKAIVNVSNQYSNLNGLTFEVVEILSDTIRLNINGFKMDFSFKEVILVDIQQIVKQYPEPSRSLPFKEFVIKSKQYKNITNYISANKIRL